MKKSKIVILDTNLWISFLISKDFTQLDEFIETKQIILAFSKELIDEFKEVVSRPKFERFFSPQDVEELMNKFDFYGKLIEVNSNIKDCRDKKDNFLLNLAIDSKADFLVTGDDDLLILKKIKQTKILTYKEFIKQLKNK